MPRVTSVGGKRIFIADGTTIGDYLVSTELFTEDVADIAAMETVGWAEAAIGTPTASTVLVTPETGYLLVNAGTKADSGSSLQRNLHPTEPSVSRAHNIIGPMTSTATLMDARSMFFFTRIGFTGTITAAWLSKMLIGWCVTDVAMLNPTTGVPALDTGGGVYFHYSEAAVVSACTQTASAAADLTTIGTALDGANFTSASIPSQWVELGFVINWTDADAGTGTVFFYKDGSLVATKTDGLPMTSTQVYSVSMELLNADTTSQNVDMAVDYIITGVSAPGKTVS